MLEESGEAKTEEPHPDNRLLRLATWRLIFITEQSGFDARRLGSLLKTVHEIIHIERELFLRQEASMPLNRVLL